MAELYRETHLAIDISAQTTVLTYTYAGDLPKIILARVELGSDTKPIVGGQNYSIIAKIDDVPVTPVSSILVPTGQTKAIMSSRSLPIEVGDVLTIQVIGAGGDTDTRAISFLIDATPAMVTELTGVGDVLVDHDYSGPDSLSYKKSNGQGIADALIWAFLASDYNNGRRSRDFVLAESQTDINGRWIRPMLLNSESYVLLYYKQGAFGPDTYNLTVT